MSLQNMFSPRLAIKGGNSKFFVTHAKVDARTDVWCGASGCLLGVRFARRAP